MPTRVTFRGMEMVFEDPPTAEEILAHYNHHSGSRSDALKPTDGWRLSSHMQSGMWFANQRSGGDATYPIQFGVVIEGDVEPTAVDRAIGRLVARHEALRSMFALRDGVVWRRVAESVTAVIRWHTTRRSLADIQSRLLSLATNIAREPFDLKASLPIRVDGWSARRGRVLIVTLHHIVADGTSIGVFVRELCDLLSTDSARATSMPKSIDTLSIIETRRKFVERSLENSDAYWHGIFSPLPDPLDLPVDFPRSPRPDFTAESVSLRVGRKASAQIHSFARQAGATPFVVVLAAFAAFLARYARTDDVTIGVPISTRSGDFKQAGIDCFVNTLPVRIPLWGNPTFAAIVERAQTAATGSVQRREYPLARVLEVVGAPREAARSSLFQALLAFQDSPPDSVEAPGVRLRTIEVPDPTTEFDLQLDATTINRRIQLRLVYRRDLFNQASVARMCRQLRHLLGSAVASPQTRLSHLAFGPIDRSRSGPTGKVSAQLALGTTVLAEFQAQVDRRPHAVALHTDVENVDYQELSRRANIVAASLRERGIGRGSVVALHIERSTTLAAALLGILRAGAAYLPLDPLAPMDRLRFTLEDSRSDLLLRDGSTPSELALIEKPPTLDLRGLAWSSGTNADEYPEPSPDDPAYVLYTSGSTGVPKGVQVPHAGLSNLARAVRRRPGMRADDTVLAMTPVSFDIAAMELLIPLTVGATARIVDSAVNGDGRRIADLLHNGDITIAQATPSTWRAVLRSGWEGSPKLRVISGGEELSPNLASDLADRAAEVWNGYGPTETTVYSSFEKFVAPATPWVALGTPVPGTSLLVLDEWLNPAPPGIPGQLFVGGIGLAHGYRRRPRLTAQQFLPNPYGSPGSRMYATGDLVRLDPDGRLQFLGRIDSQVKLRGVRIELEEVSSVLRQHPAIRDCIASLMDVQGEATLVAHVILDPLVARAARGSHEGDIRTFAARRLPASMIPEAIVVLDQFPTTASGKLDRRALPHPPVADPVRMQASAPTTQLQHQLAKVWSEVLGLDNVDMNEDFFDLGGNSLRAIQVKARLDDLGIHATVETIFSYPRLVDLDRELARQNVDAVPAPPA